ncbi:hypothetical protein CFC21_005698 [Triticum aestivum]|uniref:Crossover junction endonuclease MUS81 n=2 Tax=Triticum aestivum TaxID=4565 RepID=A0A3B5YTK7_WHEAT|nr:hypothetical protein CFC21_005698 [Triticum aestivum]
MVGSSSPRPNPLPTPPQSPPNPSLPRPRPSAQTAPSVPRKKRKVSLPKNEEVAARIFEKHRSMAAQQPAGLPDHQHQARALCTAYTGVCAAKGVGGWVVDVMEVSFQGPALICPLREVIHQEKRKNTLNKPYVPWLKSAAYAIMITLYREMERGKEFMMRQELIDAAEASGLSQHAIDPNNSRNSWNDGYSYTGWNSMKTLTNKDLVEKKSNPAKYYLTEKGKETARDCLASASIISGEATPSPTTETIARSEGEGGGASGTSTWKKPMPSMPWPYIISSSVTGRSGKRTAGGGSAEKSLLAMPPHQSNESFLKAYEVVLILDDRDTFGPHFRRKVVDNIRSQFNIPVEIKHLPVGDALWIARHKELDMEYVLDFIVERKNVDDLLGSIKDNRYKDQKLRLKKCGLRKLIYLVEGDVNTVDGSESVKTACFTTELPEGFDVQRTTGYADTENKYDHLTGSIINYYSTNFSFVKRCSDLEKVTLSDIFALQLMQVPQVTEEAALAVTSLYPTLLSLAKAYTMLDGVRRAQEEMLKNKSGMVNAGASKNIFKLIWAEG